jgi:hypothetical protein
MINSCDLDKLTDYDHDANPIPESARMVGTIRDKHTLKPIEDASIQVGNQFTLSDENGDYVFFYYLGEDDERNKPVDVRISAHNYVPIDTAIVIFPENEVNKNLEYGAPIIQRITVVDTICQAEIIDYQGADDIIEVYGIFLYRPLGQLAPTLDVIEYLNRIPFDSINVAHYQINIPNYIHGHGYLANTFWIYATDRSSYTDFASSNIRGVDSLIFSPVY